MKRLSPIANRQPPGAELATANLFLACTQGFWECKKCHHVGEPGELVDTQDIAPPIRYCQKCGYRQVRWHAPVFS